MSISRSKWLCALLAGVLSVGLVVLPAPAIARPFPPPQVTCSACLIVDDTGTELFARNAGTLLPNASTTKMTTALLTVEEASPGEIVRVSATAAGVGGGGLDLHEGDVFTVDALLHALLMDSSNDAAVALAELVAGSQSAFVRQMNRFARSIGATDTHYVTAHGLDMPGHGSSARDLALIAGKVLADPILAPIVATARTSIAGPGGSILLENRNLLLDSYPGATGVKTGFTADAGNVLVASARRGGRTLIAVAMHSIDATKDARVLLDYGWQKLARAIVLDMGTEVGAIVSEGGSTAVVTGGRLRDPASPEDLSLRFVPDDVVTLPISAGDRVGRVVVTGADGVIGTVPAVALSAVHVEDRSWISDAFSGLIGAVGELVGTP
ncbi:MAG: hypothetical protein QOG16_1644 [Actinomycetota bacterium]|nr:hypothetical protein [Actinomycetota bacterium]